MVLSAPIKDHTNAIRARLNKHATDTHQQIKELQVCVSTGKLQGSPNAGGVRNEWRSTALVDDRVTSPLRRTNYLTPYAFSQKLQKKFGAAANDSAINTLTHLSPHATAKHLFSGRQLLWCILSVATLVTGLSLATTETIIFLNAIATLFLVATIGFRLYLTLSVAGHTASSSEQETCADADLPSITILLPLYRETKSLPSLAEAILSLDYPRHKLDPKLIFEEDDIETLQEAKRLELEKWFDFIIVPQGKPKTKPKACNYALAFARGDLTVIYDAEDAPEADQLRKAATAFAKGPEDLICLQAKLNYYNKDENWLTRLFSLEYALWFDNLLPALHELRTPIPLGGTSNIFITTKLKEIGGWDPYNVTEDADLGLRIARRGYRVGLLDSTTFEEANCRTPNWIRQRSRWMKGYLQTWLVYMRDTPNKKYSHSLRDMLSVHLFIGGTVFSALINPILWMIFLFWLFSQSPDISQYFPEPLMVLNLFALLFGNSFFIYLAMIAPLKRGWPELSTSAFLAPIYWWLLSFAAYKALLQLFIRPWHWEKTDHGLSDVAMKRSQIALSKIRYTDQLDVTGER
ncbi:MAG: glycosyltransferase family 2 protein [Pseudomonadota bacterium]